MTKLSMVVFSNRPRDTEQKLKQWCCLNVGKHFFYCENSLALEHVAEGVCKFSSLEIFRKQPERLPGVTCNINHSVIL